MNMIKQGLLSYWWKLRIKEQLNPDYPVRIKTLLGNQDKRDNLVLDLPIHSYLRTRTRDQYNIEQVFQTLRFYEYEHVQEHKEK
jgi:hypothetical protein